MCSKVVAFVAPKTTKNGSCGANTPLFLWPRGARAKVFSGGSGKGNCHAFGVVFLFFGRNNRRSPRSRPVHLVANDNRKQKRKHIKGDYRSPISRSIHAINTAVIADYSCSESSRPFGTTISLLQAIATATSSSVLGDKYGVFFHGCLLAIV